MTRQELPVILADCASSWWVTFVSQDDRENRRLPPASLNRVGPILTLSGPSRVRRRAVGVRRRLPRFPIAALLSAGCLSATAAFGGPATPSILALDDLLRRVAAANQNIASERHHVESARAERSGASAIFEPQLTTEYTREANRRLNSRERFLSQASPLFDEQNDVYGGSLELLSPIGTRLRYGIQVRDLRNNLQIGYGSEPSENHNEWDGFSGITLSQPLLKNFGLGATLAPIRIAEAQAETALHQARGNVARIISLAEMSYWQLYGADEELKLRRRSIELATHLLKDNKARVEAGRMGDLEIYQAEAGLVLRETQAAEAEQRIIEASALLHAFLGEADAETGAPFTPVDAPDPNDLVVGGVPEFGSALAQHPEYLARAAFVREQEERSRFARNQRLPQFDLKASYGINGLGGTINSWYDTAHTGDYPSWFVGFQFSIPIGPQIRERAMVRSAASRLAGALTALSAAEIDLANQTGAARQRIDHLRIRLSNYGKVIEYHERVLGAELAALDLGKSDSRRVLQAEQDLSEVRADTLRQRLELRRAVLELEVLNGSYLKTRGLDLPDPTST